MEIIKHMDEHMQEQQRNKQFVCKLCCLGLESNHYIQNHMIHHVETV